MAPTTSPTPQDLPKTAMAVDAIADLARKASAAQLLTIDTKGLGAGLPPSVPTLFDPRSGHLISLRATIEDFRQQPRACEGKAVALTLGSFVELVNRHKSAHSVVFAETRWPDPKLTAVLDYHQTDHEPAFGRHTVVYDFPVTDELKAWIENDRELMSQAQFAAFLEEHAAELSAPMDAEKSEFEHLFKEGFGTPSEIIALSRDLEVFVGAHVKRQERLSSGERTVEFSEEHRDGAGGKIVIPGIFMVSVQAFVDGENVRIPARLRYRVAAGDIKWFFQLYRWEFWLRTQVQNDLARAATQTALPAYEGVSETPAAR